MATKLPNDLQLTPLGGEPRDLDDWLTTFHLASVIVDPYTNESSWVLKTAVRILEGFRGSDVRVNFVVTSNADDARKFLGPLTDSFLVFTDPERTFVKAAGIERLPAFAFIRVDGDVTAATGWNPTEWREVADSISAITSWRTPQIPAASDPGVFAGSPAFG
ncbi:MAG TPA: hypothetical protein VMM60_16525 [Ilumatobacter sp.]|nr:hypothetical protein [Ilumatobacter sp.]